MIDWNTTTAFETASAVAKGEVSAREVAEAALRRIEALEPRISALLTVTADRALETADAIDARRSAGEALPPLAGVPVAVKANMAVRGVETNCASKILKGWKPPYTATVPGLL
ncbi:MAG TPA: amidase family protein, partial [Armatimonadota bacterium]|nr:amidase family protein [Armatimonadota bacterium]